MNLKDLMNAQGRTLAPTLPINHYEFATEERFEADCKRLLELTTPIVKEHFEDLKLMERLNNCATLEDISKLELNSISNDAIPRILDIIDTEFKTAEDVENLIYRTALYMYIVDAMVNSGAEYIMRNVQQRAGRIEYEKHMQGKTGKRKSKIIMPGEDA